MIPEKDRQIEKKRWPEEPLRHNEALRMISDSYRAVAGIYGDSYRRVARMSKMADFFKEDRIESISP